MVVRLSNTGKYNMPNYREMLERHHKEAYSWALKCCNYNIENTQETMQNTYLKILDGKAKYNKKSTFKTWLFSIIRNTAADMNRTQSRDKLFVMNPGELSDNFNITVAIEEKIEHKETKQLLHKALEILSKKQQEILRLVFYHDMSIVDAATIMEVSVGSARTHYERGKQHLRKLLIQYDNILLR